MNGLLKLLKFLAWYGIAVVTLFYLLPVAGLMIEVQYEALNSSAKFFAVIGFFMVLAIWQVISLRDRMRRGTVETLDGMAL
jgi:hypothetical protein